MLEQQLSKIDQILKMNILVRKKNLIRKTNEYDLSTENQQNNKMKENETYDHVHAIFGEYHLIIDHSIRFSISFARSEVISKIIFITFIRKKAIPFVYVN